MSAPKSRTRRRISLRRAERRGHVAVQPVAGGRRRGRERAPWPAKPAGVVELQAERRDERRVVERRRRLADEVRGHAAAGEERPEVDRRALDRGVAPPAHSTWATLRPPRSAAGRSSRPGGRPGANAECGSRTAAVDVEGVVGRAVDARPRARREAVPARAGVRRRLGQQAPAGRLRPLLEERAPSSASGPGRRTARRGPGACRPTAKKTAAVARGSFVGGWGRPRRRAPRRASTRARRGCDGDGRAPNQGTDHDETSMPAGTRAAWGGARAGGLQDLARPNPR